MLYIRTLSSVTQRMLLVAIIVTVRKQIKPPKAMRSSTFGQTQCWVHDYLSGSLKELLCFILHLILWPTGMQFPYKLLGFVPVDVLRAPIANPLRSPVFPVDDPKPMKVLEGYEFVDVGSSFAEVLAQALVLRKATIDGNPRAGVVRIVSQVTVVKDGHVGAAQGLVVVCNNVEDTKVQIHLVKETDKMLFPSIGSHITFSILLTHVQPWIEDGRIQ